MLRDHAETRYVLVCHECGNVSDVYESERRLASECDWYEHNDHVFCSDGCLDEYIGSGNCDCGDCALDENEDDNRRMAYPGCMCDACTHGRRSECSANEITVKE